VAREGRQDSWHTWCRDTGLAGHLRHGACKASCGRTLMCGHACKAACHEGKPCPGCKARCWLGCPHQPHGCPKPCSEPCVTCAQPCVWACEHQGRCPLPCGAPCTRWGRWLVHGCLAVPCSPMVPACQA
jgi:hypothetical protein